MGKETALELHPMRLNWHYVIWYRNLTVFLVSAVTPLVLLAYWNFNTLSVMLRRRRLRNRPSISSENNALFSRQESLHASNVNGVSEENVPLRLAALEALNTSSILSNPRRYSRSHQGNILLSYLIFFSNTILTH